MNCPRTPYQALPIQHQVMTSHSQNAWRRLGSFGTAAVFLVVLLVLASSSAIVTVAAASTSNGLKPTPDHPIIGSRITLPSALFLANRPGSGAPLLVTSTQATQVATTMWQQWEAALVSDDTQALTQLISPGPTLQGTINACADPNGQCVAETQPRPINSLSTVVPVQDHYPLYFLAQIQTTNFATGLNGLAAWEPWVELQILTKKSPTSSWMLSFDTGYDAPGGGTPTLLPFNLVSASTLPGGSPGLINVAPVGVPPHPPGQYLSLLGAYWQSFADVGHAPRPSAFIDDGYTSGVGQNFARFPQGTLYAGHREDTSFGASKGQSWAFTANGGYPLICGSVTETTTYTATSAGPMYQNADESNYGVPLPPGDYSRITAESAHSTCIFVDSGSLDAVGGLVYQYAVTGTKVAAPATPPPSPHPPKQPSYLTDLETAYGVLGYQLSQYLEELEACLPSGSSPCSTAFAADAAHQFARFSTSLLAFSFPSRVSGQVSTLISSATRLSRLFAGLDGTTQNVRVVASGLINAITVFEQYYSQLVRDLR